MSSLENKIKSKAKELGYENCGIIEATTFEEFSTQLTTRSALFPHAASFYDSLRRLAIPKESLAWAKSIIVCVRRYDKHKIPDGLEQLIGKVFLVDGRLSYSKEYASYIAFETFLHELGFRTAPNVVPARWSAVKAGLGKFRNNNFLYTEQGSWLWIDTWTIDKQLDYEKPIDSSRFSCPADCNECIKACPTAALSAPLTMDATKCIACLTLRSNPSPPEDLLPKMGTYLYGCDICQNVCPANNKTWQDNDSYFPEPLSLQDVITLEDIFTMDEETYRTIVQPRFWYIGKDDICHWKCHALRSMANENLQKYEKYFTQALEDPNESVRMIASWALAKAKNKLAECK